MPFNASKTGSGTGLYVHGDGYLVVYLGCRATKGVVGAHRVVAAACHGADFGPGREVAHACGNAWCLNPAHLLIALHRDNVISLLELRPRRLDFFSE